MSDSEKIIKKIVSKNNHWKVDLLSRWREIVGSWEKQVKIEAILDKTLILGVCHPAVAHQLLMSSDLFMSKLKKMVPNCKIERLAFKTVDFKTEEQKAKEEKVESLDGEQQLSITNPFGLGSNNVPLNKKELKSLDSVCCERLKKLLRSFYARCKRKEALNAQALQIQSQSYLDSGVDFSLFGYG